MTARGVALEIHGDLAHLVLDRPPRNEMNSAFFQDLHDTVVWDLPRLDLRGLIVYGRGRHFSSGADVAELRTLVARHPDPDVIERLTANIAAIHAFSDLPYPAVAALSGCCLGSGLELALACRHRVAATNAVLALPEAEHGLMPGCGGTVRLPALVGLGRALELVLSGRRVLADEALALGLVDRVVERRSLVAEAERLLREVLARGGTA